MTIPMAWSIPYDVAKWRHRDSKVPEDDTLALCPERGTMRGCLLRRTIAQQEAHRRRRSR